ncbi:hypothetical protein [Alcanivorax sp.]|uniref:hypothetical protein n=1 Tax=Alcanivorax sp. TaxID=1872427 RepID=UPI003A910B8E
MALSSVLRQVENSIKKNQLVHYLINPLLIFLIFFTAFATRPFHPVSLLRVFVLFFMGIIYLPTNIESSWGSISARFSTLVVLPAHLGFTQQHSPCARKKNALTIKSTAIMESLLSLSRLKKTDHPGKGAFLSCASYSESTRQTILI